MTHQQTPWKLTELTTTTTENVRVLTNVQGALILKQADDILWLHPEQVDQLRVLLKEFQ